MFTNTSHTVHKRNSRERPSIIAIILTAIAVIACIGAFFVLVGFAATCVENLEHYNRVYQNPMTVTATVIRHDKYEDEDGTDYRSYIFYTANGTSYSNIRFENKNHASDLTPIGTQLPVQVSPENPACLISELKSEGNMLIFWVPFLTFLCACLPGFLINRMRSRGVRGTPEMETLMHDLYLTIWGRISGFFWILLCVIFFGMCWRYPAVYQNKTLGVGTVCGVIWLLCMLRNIRDTVRVRNQHFQLCWDQLVKKEYIPDSDGDVYRLYYQSGEKTWDQNVSKKHYESVCEGSRIPAVYFIGKKKPVLHYDYEGNAR